MACCPGSTALLHNQLARHRVGLVTGALQPPLAVTQLVSGLNRRKLTCRSLAGQGCACRAQKGSSTDSSILGTKNTLKLAARERHALFNDFTLTIPFGIVNGIAGVVSLAFQGGWGGLLTSLAGALVFTLGTMSHHSTYEGTDAGWGLTLTSAAIAAALARHYYLKAIVGVAGTMVMTIASAIISLGLVYNIVAGGNKLEFGPASGSPAPNNNSNREEASSQSSSDTNSPSTSFGWQRQPERPNKVQQSNAPAEVLHTDASPWGANACTVMAVTGVVLYAQGLWGLWGETVGYSPAGLAAAAASGLGLLAIAKTLLPQAVSDEADIQ
ncbi:hypothetical protein WJX77_007583 [Trebouxia sp. C0004]